MTNTTLPQMTAVEVQRSMKMYGCNIEEFVASVTDSITYQLMGMPGVVCSLLSDVQEMIEHGSNEQARQYINRVKYLVHQKEKTVD